jgi:hypothetical protein
MQALANDNGTWVVGFFLPPISTLISSSTILENY